VSEIVVGPDGFPIMFAQAPGQVAPQPGASGIAIQRGARSGNPNADPANGQFASGGGNAKITSGQEIWAKVTPQGVQYVGTLMTQYQADSITVVQQGTEAQVVLMKDGQMVVAAMVPTSDSPQETVDSFVAQLGPTSRSGIPVGVTPEEWTRRHAAVRDAARESHDMNEGDARDFLQGRAQQIDKVDMQQFLHDVREQRLDDLADVLDQQIRGRVESMKRSRSTVRVVAPKGWARRVFNGLKDAEVVELIRRMEGKGWSQQDLVDQVLPRIKEEKRREAITQLLGKGSDKSKDKGIRLDGLSLWPSDDEFIVADDNDGSELTRQVLAFSQNLTTEIVKNLPPPVINVYNNIPAPNEENDDQQS
jgi:hypothetical protein